MFWLLGLNNFDNKTSDKSELSGWHSESKMFWNVVFNDDLIYFFVSLMSQIILKLLLLLDA